MHRLLLHDDDQLEILYPVGNDVIALAGPTASQDVHHRALVASLNEAMENGQVLWSLHDTVVMGIEGSRVVKIGTSLDHDGITNLDYINTHAPDIPAPSCLGSLRSGPRTYFFMTRADGVTLETIWPQLLPAHKLSVQRQLNSIFRTLRAKRPVSHHDRQHVPSIGSFVSGACKDPRRLRRESEGRVRGEADFNDFLCSQRGRTQTPWIKMIRSFMSDGHRMVMTHGDLHPRNIMVEWDTSEGEPDGEDGLVRVTSLIDWKLDGWYPEYWEYTKALSAAQTRGPLADWCDYLPTDAIGTWPVEFSIDLLISRWLG